MNRRDLLKMIAAATGMAMVGGELWAAGIKSPDAGKALYTADDVAMLDEIAEIKGTEGILLTFDDFVQGVEDFGQKIQPLMQCRQNVVMDLAEQAPVTVLEKSA